MELLALKPLPIPVYTNKKSLLHSLAWDDSADLRVQGDGIDIFADNIARVAVRINQNWSCAAEWAHSTVGGDLLAIGVEEIKVLPASRQEDDAADEFSTNIDILILIHPDGSAP